MKKLLLIGAAALLLTSLVPDDASAQRGGGPGFAGGGGRGGGIGMGGGGGFRGGIAAAAFEAIGDENDATEGVVLGQFLGRRLQGEGDRKLSDHRAMTGHQKRGNARLLPGRHTTCRIEGTKKCAHDGVSCAGMARRWS